ncbi:hypothetical protein [Sphingosinicella sp.]|uniref:hypothetical protein n=1 Tax=Sphingosinicella sp. TaxID=1917971 RepID=UPI004037CD8D
MDMAFLQRARRMLGESRPAPLDHGLLLAALAGRSRAPASEASAAIEEPVVEVLSGGCEWRRAARAQGGCFNRAEAGRGRNAP